jgi:hypothetical protein
MSACEVSGVLDCEAFSRYGLPCDENVPTV